MIESHYIEKFKRLQQETMKATETVASSIAAGATEFEIAVSLNGELAAVGFRDHWYPILVCAGENSGKPLSRRFHLPSKETPVRSDDIVIVDSTPLDETVWGNWSVTVAIGDDPFFTNLVRDSQALVEKTYQFAQTSETIGQIFDFCMQLIDEYGMVSLDPRDDVGHSIFQVPAGQRVEDTPLEQRLFISEEYRDAPVRGIISIEPQVGRKHPIDGITYGAKQQRIIIR